ncbi:MAG TPA: DnaB-like helicase N-terminal domain-containing protein, partial [Thermoanaerobaculia bacterium]|nr:DnaB-like helicase N-terminal domain-containing protein [Thermoanaerobaculia bacterium]
MTVAQLDVSLDRQMPQSPDAERAVLGAILINNHAFYRVIGTIDTEDFFKDGHRTIFATMRRMAENSQEIETLTLKEELAKHAQLDQAGGVAYISALLDVVPDVANVERYARIVKEKSMLRRLIVMGNSVMRAALDAPSEPTEVLGIAEKSLYEIAEGTTDKGFVGLDRITRTNMTAIEQIHSAGKLLTGIPTGYDRFNEFTSGFQLQDLIILAARPSMGKAQPLDAKILTRRGFVCMGSLRVGDELASIDGAASRVTGIFPQGEREIFRMELSDGRSAECCREHLWRVGYRGWSAPRVLSAKRLMAMLQKKRYQNRLYIETFGGDFGSDEGLPMDPWLLGFLLGDGTTHGTSVAFSTARPEILERLRDAIERDLEITAGGFDPTSALESLGLWDRGAREEFIPKRYFSASLRSRIRLLKGLLHTDGRIKASGSVRFVSSSERLSQDVVDLVRSIGGIASYVKQSMSFVCNLLLPADCGVTLTGAKETRRATPRARLRRLNIRSITPTRISPTQCIAVSHPS